MLWILERRPLLPFAHGRVADPNPGEGGLLVRAAQAGGVEKIALPQDVKVRPGPGRQVQGGLRGVSSRDARKFSSSTLDASTML